MNKKKKGKPVKKDLKKKREKPLGKKVEKKVEKNVQKGLEFLDITHPISQLPKTFSQKAADKITKSIGSWPFIILFVVYIIGWIMLNVYAIINNWDPYPFILLNLTLSILAALQAPLILMSQNRQAQKDRVRAKFDYALNRKAEKEIREIKKQLNRIEKRK